jgi:hypothetical protein
MLLAEWAQAVYEFWVGIDLYGYYPEDTELQKRRENPQKFQSGYRVT